MSIKRSMDKKIVRTTIYVPDPEDGADCSFDLIEDFRKKYDENGNAVYVKVGERSISSYVSSFENVCSLTSILERCSFLPVREKVAYLQQTDGVSADLSNFPTDGTSARIMLAKLKAENPDIFSRISKGEKINDIIKSYIDSSKSLKNDNSKKEENINVEA